MELDFNAQPLIEFHCGYKLMVSSLYGKELDRITSQFLVTCAGLLCSTSSVYHSQLGGALKTLERDL